MPPEVMEGDIDLTLSHMDHGILPLFMFYLLSDGGDSLLHT